MNTKPFLKWAGSKSRLINKLIPYFPKDYTNYFEPFLGSGSVYFYLQSIKNTSACISDINYDLINTFIVVKLYPNRLLKRLSEYSNLHSISLYTDTRIKFNIPFNKFNKYELDLEQHIERAAIFIYLNKTCFNGLYRVNKRGEFNTPMGNYKKPLIYDEETINRCHKLLNSNPDKNFYNISCVSYNEALYYADINDFVYLDPPYDPVSKTSNFTSYTANSFSSSDQIELRNIVNELTDRKVKVMISNSDTLFIRDAYKDYNIYEIETNRSINSDASKRGKVKELVITNYKEN